MKSASAGAGINLGMLSKATELKSRIWFLLGALIVFRLGTYIPLPGVDSAVLTKIFAQKDGGLLGIFNMFSGGALGRMTIFALNIMPYITMSIIMQLLTVMSPQLAALKKDGGPAGRAKINQYTRYGTIVMASFQSYGIATFSDVVI
jgi:preprotein translocase subunit SecY